MSEQVDGLTSKRAVCSIKGGVPSHQREASFTSRKRPLCLQTILFTPLSIRRGGGGEAASLFKEGVSSYQGEASFISRKRPLQSEEGVSFFLFFCSLRTKLYLVTLKLYDTSISAKPYFK